MFYQAYQYDALIKLENKNLNNTICIINGKPQYKKLGGTKYKKTKIKMYYRTRKVKNRFSL